MPSTRMNEAEWKTRLDLAACYRLVDLFGWSDLINTRITARVRGQDDHFPINPYGLLFDEITASSLVKIDAEGNKVEPSESEVNSGGFAMPSTVHMARPEVACVIHTHSIAGCAVSMQRDGLLPLNQHALQVIGDVAYHDYEGTGRNPEERRHRRISAPSESRIAHTQAPLRRGLHELPSPAPIGSDRLPSCWSHKSAGFDVGQPGLPAGQNAELQRRPAQPRAGRPPIAHRRRCFRFRSRPAPAGQGPLKTNPVATA